VASGAIDRVTFGCRRAGLPADPFGGCAVPRVVGVVTLDDIVRTLAEELDEVGSLMDHEEQRERRYRV